MTFSSVPLLAGALAACLATLAVRSTARGVLGRAEAAALAAWLAAMCAWGLVSANLAISGSYRADAFLATLPGFWLPMVPFGLTAALFALPSFRRGVVRFFAHNPRALVLVQGFRALAIGGVVKGFTGDLPPSFALPIGIPDFVFGVSALWLGHRAARRPLTPRGLIAWNLAGIAVILPAPLLMQTALPGPLYTFASQPDARALLDFPMALAPTVLVPVFMTMNAIHAAVLWIDTRRALAEPRIDAALTRPASAPPSGADMRPAKPRSHA